LKNILLFVSVLSPNLVSADEVTQAITFKCVGDTELFSQFNVLPSKQEFERLNAQGLLVTVDTEELWTIRSLPAGLLEDQRLTKFAATRVFQILPGKSISTEEVTFPMEDCGWMFFTDGRGVSCELAPPLEEREVINFQELDLNPPYSVNFRMVYAADIFQKEDNDKSVVATYYYENFHSSDCEVIDPIPSKDVWFQ